MNKILFTLIAILLLAVGAQAQACVKYADIAKLGGKIITAGTTSTTTAIKAFPSATVDIYNTGTLVHTSLFSDNACSVVKSNPFTAGSSDASFSFYLAPTRIDIRIAPSGGNPSPFTVSDILVPTYTAQSIKETSGPALLTVGAIADKQFLRRSGTALTGAVVFNWFNVQDYGAVGNGTTDDTAAINAAIDACNAVGKGVIYGPSAIYKTTSTWHTITCDVDFGGDGNFGAATTFPTNGATLFTFTSGSTNAINVASKNAQFHDFSLSNTAGSTPTVGYGINVTGSDIYQKVSFERVTIHRFFHALHQAGGLWHIRDVTASSSVDYQVYAENPFNDDAGDWDIDHLNCITGGTYPPLCLKLKNGGRINNLKALGTVNGIELVSGANTSNLQINNASIELFTGNGMLINGGAVPFSWANVQLNQVEFLPDPANTTNNAILANGTQNLQLNNIKCVASVTPSAACVGVGGASSNWSVGTVDLNGWNRDFQTGNGYTGTPLPASAVGAETIASNKIMPQYQFFHLVSGGATLKNIFLNTTTMTPYENRNYVIYAICDDAAAWDATGNIGNTGTAATGTLLVVQWNRGIGAGGKWYIK